MPCPAPNLDVAPELIGAVHQSLNGTTSVDRIAHRRSWAMQWPALDEDTLTYLQLVGAGMVTGPLRMLDPMIRNLLPHRVASGGSYNRSTEGFAALDGTTMEWAAITDPPTSVPVRGVIVWARTSTAAAGLRGGGDAADRVPLLTGVPVRVSMWVRGAAINCRPGYEVWDSAGTGTTTEGGDVALSVSTWTELSINHTPAGGVSLAPRLQVPSGQVTSNLQTTGWQVAYTDAPTTWTMGGGAPTVVASDLSHTYLMPGLVSYGMTLLEART